MKKTVLPFALLALTFGFACSKNENRTAANDNTAPGSSTAAPGTTADNRAAANVDNRVEDGLKQANLGDVRVSKDDDKRVLTLSGDVRTDADKAHAAEIAKANASGYTVANEISVRPEGEAGSVARKVSGNTDDAIKSAWKATEAKMRLENQHINADVKEGVITLKGDVDNNTLSQKAETAARKIPGVKQVVNELEVKSAAQ